MKMTMTGLGAVLLTAATCVAAEAPITLALHAYSFKDRTMVETIETDIGHWVPAGIDPADGIRQLMASRIFALHFVDVTKDGKPAPYGTGISNLDKVLETLKEKGAPVILTCEYEQWDDLTEKNVRACVEWFNKHAEK